MIGWRELIIVLVIVLLVFGTKRLSNIGSDLGNAIKGFKKGMQDDSPPESLDRKRPDSDSKS